MLKVENLKTYFYLSDHVVKAVDGISFEVTEGQTVGLVGESGSGKSVTALSLLRLVQVPGKICGGNVLWDKKDVLKFKSEELRKLRGKEIGMIFQDPIGSLNPVITVGTHLLETLKVHYSKDSKKCYKRALELLETVGLPNQEKIMKKYAHELSGGMCQRVMIALAIAPQPRLLIADEPTTALDVTIQAEILKLLKELIEQFKMSLLLISHDLHVVKFMVKNVLIMKDGKIVEAGKIKKVFSEPEHGYTRRLLKATL
ncbi:ABC transporter ATP-binding protein [Candidatus Margulisiibacteriota bacterium]